MRAGLLAICIPAVFLLTSEVGQAEERIVASGIRGALVICGGGRLAPEIFDTFMELAGGTTHVCRIIWRESDKIGVKFLDRS